MSTIKFVAQKVLNTKEQEGKTIVLMQWKGFSIQQATWEPSQKFDNIDLLIQEYQLSKVNDQVKNFALKQSQRIDCGQNPYKQTSRHGHFMYGDQPTSIESIQVFRNSEESYERQTIVCEITWKDRVELDNEGNEVNVILQNSFIDSKTVNEFRPDFLMKFYHKKLHLNDS